MSIQLRGKQVYLIEITKGYKFINGKRKPDRHTETFHGTKKQAQAREAELKAQLLTGGLINKTDMTLADLLQEYLKTDSYRYDKSQTAYDRDETIARCHIIPDIGHLKIQDLRYAHISQHHSKIRESGNHKTGGPLAETSVRKHQSFLKRALDYAIDSDMLENNPAIPKVKKPSKRSAGANKRKRDIKALTRDEFARLIEAVKDQEWEPIFYLAGYTGLRRGELMALTWADIDFENQTISVVKATKENSLGIIEGDPKTDGSIRDVYNGTSAIEVLQDLKKDQKEKFKITGRSQKPGTKIFERADGSVPRLGSVTHAFKRECKKLGIDCNLHGARHTTASMMLARGVDIATISKRLGHSSVAFTASTYLHTNPEAQQKAAQVLDDYFPGPIKTTEESAEKSRV